MLKCRSCNAPLDEGQFIEYEDKIYSGQSKQQMCPYCGMPYSPLVLSRKLIHHKGLNGELIHSIRTALVDSGTMDNNQVMRQIFIDRHISPWSGRIPEGYTVSNRANGIINYLYHQNHISLGNALVLYLEVVGDTYNDEYFYKLSSEVVQSLV